MKSKVEPADRQKVSDRRVLAEDIVTIKVENQKYILDGKCMSWNRLDCYAFLRSLSYTGRRNRFPMKIFLEKNMHSK